MPVRHYLESDRGQIESLRCHRFTRHTKGVQKAIREAPSSIDELGLEILVCEENSKILAVAVYKIYSATRCEILLLGVHTDRQNQGIGQRLKGTLMEEVLSQHPNCRFVSQVHVTNDLMRHINDKLLAETAPRPDDGELLITIVRPNTSGGDVTPSK